MRKIGFLFLMGLLAVGCSDKTITEPEANDCVDYNVTFLSSGISQELYDIFFIDINRGWAVGADGVIISTINGGQDWFLQDSGQAALLYSVQFRDADTGWACGTDGVFLKTVDGGQNWADTVVSSRHLTDLYIYDRLRAWVVGDSVIIHTQDGGHVFLVYPPQVSEVPILYRVDFTDLLNGWTVGTGGTILHTDNGGNSWLRQPTDMLNPLFGIDMLDVNHGWAVGINGTVMHTSNAGVSWTKQSTPVGAILRGVAFSDSLIGLAVGDQGTAVSTVNGGATFDSMELGTSSSLRQIFQVNSRTAMACGENGTIIKFVRVDVPCED